MPNLPYTSQVDARSLRSSASGIARSGGADAFGAQVGGALQELGQAVGVTTDVVARVADKKRREDTANAMANFDPTPDLLQLRNQVGPDGKGYHDLVKEKYPALVEDHANRLADDAARMAFRQEAMSRFPQYTSNAAEYEWSAMQEFGKREANTALSTLQNKVMGDPTAYDLSVQDGFAVIDSRTDMPASQRELMKQEWRYNAAKSRFDGMMNAATTAAAVDAIAADLAGQGGKDWTAEMKPEDYARVADKLGSMRTQLRTKVKAEADAAVKVLKERSETTTSFIDPEDLRSAQSLVKEVGDPVQAAQIARVARNEDIKRTIMKLPPSEIRARIAQTNGSPDAVFPNFAPEVSTAINSAAKVYNDVSPALLAATWGAEAGNKLKAKRPKVKPEYTPMALTTGFDVRNMRPDVLDAATMAGQMLGSALPVVRLPDTPGQKSDNTIDVSTLGMSAADKARTAAALIDAGFTGFREEAGVLRAKMIDAVPATFKQKEGGVVFGGWSDLSPEVSSVLMERGFMAGAKSDVIKRTPLVTVEPNRYDFPTDILGPDGKPASTAIGPGQFIESTWLELVYSPGVAEQWGLDLSAMSKQEVLALRGDVNFAALGTALLATRNRAALSTALGREPSDAEIYMAHFMGADGASTLIAARERDPSISAADLMPKAAEANKPIFYRDGQKLSVQDVYVGLAQKFGLSPDNVAFEDVQQYQRGLTALESGLAKDPMMTAAQTGTFVMPDLGAEGGFAAQSGVAQSVANYYNIPMRDMKPFTDEQANYLKSQIDTGSADDIVRVMAGVAQMGPDVSKAALRQLGEKDPAFAFAGKLYMAGGVNAAQEIIRGRKILNDNPSIRTQLGLGDGSNKAMQVFSVQAGPALALLKPEDRQSILDASVAHWTNRSVSAGSSEQLGNSKIKFEDSVNAVLGGSADAPVIDVVNGEKTLLPTGISADVLDRAIDRITLEDIVAMSTSKQAPVLADGTVADPADFKYELKLRAVGDGTYRLMLADGSFLAVPSAPGSPIEAYTIKPTPELVNSIVSRPGPRSTASRGDTWFNFLAN